MNCTIHPLFARIAWSVILGISFSLPKAAFAQEQDTSNIAAVGFPNEPEVPERKVKFEESNEPYPLRLFAADPGLLEQKYVARLHFETADRPLSGAIGSRNAALYSSAVESDAQDPNTAHIIHLLMENIPRERRPDNEIVSLLSNPHHVRVGREVARQAPQGPVTDLAFSILGKNPEEVKVKARAILDLYDYGLSYAIQKSLIDQMRSSKGRLDKAAKSASEQPDISLLEKKIEEIEPIGTETITELKTQLRLISVDMAGVKARIDACTTILKRDDVHGKRTAEQVESIKITAEIELVGLTARRDALDQIVQQDKKRNDLRAQIAKHNGTKQTLQNTVRNIKELEVQRQSNLPLAVHENKISIRPIKWEPATP